MKSFMAGTICALALSAVQVHAADASSADGSSAEGQVLPDELTLNVGEVKGVGANVTLVLTKRSMRSENYLCGIWSDDGFKKIIFPVSTYRGYVKEDPLIYVNANIEPGGTLNANFSENRGNTAQIRDVKVDVGKGKSTRTMSSGNKIVPVSSLKQRTVPTPGGYMVPLVPMRQYQWIITVPQYYTAKHDPETIVSKVEQRWNAGDFCFARDVGTCWELDVIILVAPNATKPVDWKVICPGNPDRPKNHMVAFIKPPDTGPNTGKGRSLGVIGLGLEAGILMHEGAHIHGDPWHQLDDGDGLFGGGAFFGTNNCAILIAEQKNRGEEEYKGAIYSGVLPPRAAHDFANTRKDTPVEIDVLDNDYSGKGNPLSLKAVEPKSDRAGTVAISKDGTKVVYTPAAGFVGIDYLSYTVVDSEGAGNRSGRVKVDVSSDEPTLQVDFEKAEKDSIEWLRKKNDWRIWFYDEHDKRPDAEKVTYHFPNLGSCGGRADVQWIDYVPAKGVIGNGLLNPVGGLGSAQADFLMAGGDPGRGSLSVSIWVLYPEKTKGSAILTKSPYGFKTVTSGWTMAREGEVFRFVGNTVRLDPKELFELHSTEPIQEKMWYHLVMIIDRETKKLRAYVNNKELTQSSSTSSIPDAVIDYHAPLHLFNGIGWKSWSACPMLVDELKIYTKALTPEQVAALYAEGKDAPVPDLPAPAPRPAPPEKPSEDDKDR